MLHNTRLYILHRLIWRYVHKPTYDNLLNLNLLLTFFFAPCFTKFVVEKRHHAHGKKKLQKINDLRIIFLHLEQENNALILKKCDNKYFATQTI